MLIILIKIVIFVIIHVHIIVKKIMIQNITIVLQNVQMIKNMKYNIQSENIVLKNVIHKIINIIFKKILNNVLIHVQLTIIIKMYIVKLNVLMNMLIL